jgi:hypothetical protein
VVLVCLHPPTPEFWQEGSTPVLDCTYQALGATDSRRALI